MGHRTTESPNQSDDALIVRERFTYELLGSVAAAVVDELLEQDRAKPFPLRSDRTMIANSAVMLSGSAMARTTPSVSKRPGSRSLIATNAISRS